MNDERATLAKKVKSFRKENNINQFEFAEDCGISDGLVSMIERKNTNITLDTLQLLAARMAETVSELLENPELYSYCLIPTQVCINDMEVTTYGIGVLKNHIMLEYVLDISNDQNAVVSLLNLCDEGQVEPIHLKDIVENFLVE